MRLHRLTVSVPLVHLAGPVFLMVLLGTFGQSPMIFLATSDCTGAEIIGNGLYGGNGRFVAGRGKPAVVKDNKALLLDDSFLRSASPNQDAPRPIPEVPSIYEWQHKQ